MDESPRPGIATTRAWEPIHLETGGEKALSADP